MFRKVQESYLQGEPEKGTHGLSGDLIDLRGTKSDDDLRGDVQAFVFTLRNAGFTFTEADEATLVDWMLNLNKPGSAVLPCEQKQSGLYYQYTPENKGGQFWQFVFERAHKD